MSAVSHLCPITPGWGVRSWRCLDRGAQVHRDPGHLGERGAGSRAAALAPGEVTRPSQSSSNYVSDTRSHKQTPDTGCLFLDWKSLFLLTQVVGLEHAEHQQSQQHHARPSPKGQCQQPSEHFLSSLSTFTVEKDEKDFLNCSRGDHKKLS